MRDAAAIEAAVRDGGLLAPARPALVLLSGGRDSVCLLDLAVRILGRARVRALHVNYGLRAGSTLDERFCGELCERLAVPLAVERPPGPAVGNVQAWARQVRYAAASKAAEDGDILVGHTASDQVETVLYRLISSPSRRALLGMRERDGRLVRPLLGVTREEITRYCGERGLAFRDDPSNQTDAYVRNRIRNEVVPLLAELHPGFERNVLALARVLRAEAEVLESQVRAALGGRPGIPLHELRGLPSGLARLVLQELADAALGTPAAGVAARAGELLAMGDDAALDLPGGVRARTRGGWLGFELGR